MPLTTPVNATLGAIPRHAYTILNDDPNGLIQLSAAAYSFAESSGTVSITATRVGSSSGIVGVSFATANGTATAGSDYTAAPGKLEWADGDMADKNIEVAIADNALDEPDETFFVRLSVPTGGAKLGVPVSATGDDHGQ